MDLKFKMLDLRPCDNCDGPLVPIFQVIRVSMAVLNRKATNEQLGLTQMMGGTGMGAHMGAHGDNVVDVLAQQKDGEWTDLLVCQQCYIAGVDPCQLAEKRAHAIEAQAASV